MNTRTVGSKKSINSALVTGATGFVGSNLVKHLVKNGWRVHVITRPTSNINSLKKILRDISLYTHTGGSEAMMSIMEVAKPDIVYHLASVFLAHHDPKDVIPMIRGNLEFGTQLVDAMVKSGTYKMVNVGTSWQHYGNEDYNPVNLYAATKQAFEVILRFYLETSPLKVITLKLFDTYGPGDLRPKLFNLLKKVAEEQKPLAMSPGEQLIDIVYIDDVVSAFILAAERLLSGKSEKNEDYEVSSGKPIKLRNLVKIYEEVVGKKLPIEWGGRPYREREVMLPWNTGQALPGWVPRTALKEGIQAMFTGPSCSHTETNE